MVEAGGLLAPPVPGVLPDELCPAPEDDVVPDRGPDGLKGLLVSAVSPEITVVHVTDQDRVVAALIVAKPRILKADPSESLFWFCGMIATKVPLSIDASASKLFIVYLEIHNSVWYLAVQVCDLMREAAPDNGGEAGEAAPGEAALVHLVSGEVPGGQGFCVHLRYEEQVREKFG